MPTAHEEDFNLPLWKIVLRHLLRPRTWIYPIIVLIVVYFLRRRRKTRSVAVDRRRREHSPVRRTGKRKVTPRFFYS